jgi:hypothetical protein
MFHNPSQHPVNIIQNIVIPKAQNAPALPLQKSASLLVVGNLILVLATVEFDDCFLFDAGEVGDVGSDGVLAAEAVAV